MNDLVKEESIQSTENEEFLPTPHMEKWLDTAIQLETDEINKIAEESRVDRSTWYLWIKNPKFVDWYDTEYSKGLKANRWKLNAIGMKRAKNDHKYWQDMQRITGNLKEEKGTNVQINNFVPILGGATKEK